MENGKETPVPFQGVIAIFRVLDEGESDEKTEFDVDTGGK